MKYFYQIMLLLCVYAQATNAQVGINATGTAPDPAAMLDVSSNNKGLLIPRVALTASNSAAPIGVSVVISLLVYNTATAGTSPNNVVPGFYYWNGTAWAALVGGGGGGGGSGWGILGNAGTIDGINFMGTTDNIPLNFRVNNLPAGQIGLLANTFYGSLSGGSNTTGSSNVANGYGSLAQNTVGGFNTAIGVDALRFNVAGGYSTAIGFYAMKNVNNSATPFVTENVAVGYSALRGSAILANNTGTQNTAIGTLTLLNNSSGYQNTAVGDNVLAANTTGFYNTALGSSALSENTTGAINVAIGNDALSSNVAGNYATAVGYRAMQNTNSSASTFNNTNVALGYQALQGPSPASGNTGNGNTALGYRALETTSTGSRNTATGTRVLNQNTLGVNNTANGYYALNSNTIGNGNTAIGSSTLYSNVAGNNAIAIGNEALFYTNNTATAYDNTNVAIGFESLRGTTTASANTGFSNTAVGYQTLRINSTGDYNTAIGLTALTLNTTGDRNTALGTQTLNNNTAGNSNTAVGTNALFWKAGGDNNTAVGDEAGVGAAGIGFSNCTFVGANSTIIQSRTNVTMLGAGITNSQCTADNQVLLGNTSISQIRAQVTSITAYSDARFKSNIDDNIQGLSFITKLKPVTYNQNPEILHRIWGTSEKEIAKMDFSGIKKERFIGFLAQDVEKAANECGFKFPGIEAPKNDKEVYSLRYVDFIMPMVKAIQEQQVMIDKQNKMIEDKANRITQLEVKLQKMADLEIRLSAIEASLNSKKTSQKADAEK